MKGKSFAFTREGLEDSKNYKDYKGMILNYINENPELLPIVLLGAVSLAAFISIPGAAAVASKTAIYNSAEVAFKYLVL